MAKIQNKAKRVLAIALSLMMVLGACFTGMVTASAEDTLATGLGNVATTSTNYSTVTTYSTIADIDGGGITYTAEVQNGSLSPYVHNASGGAISPEYISTLQFNNFTYTENEQETNGKFMVLLASKIGSNTGNFWRLGADTAALEFDAVAGTITLVKGVSVGTTPTTVCTIATNTALTGLAGNAFTLSLQGTEEGGLAVTVVVNDTTVAGTVSATDWESITNRPTTDVYYSVSSVMRTGGWAQISIEYYGFTTMKAPFQSGLADGLNVATAALAGMSASAGNRTDADLAGGGVYVQFAQSGSYYPYIMNTDIGTFRDNNYRLQFANYVSTSTATEIFGYRQFAIGFVRSSTATDNYRKFFKKASGIRFDTVNGKIDLIEGNNATDSVLSKYDVITDEALLYDNFTGHAFTVDLYNTATTIDVVVTIADYDENGDKVLKGSIPLDVYTGLTYPLTTSYGFFSVSGIEHALGANPWSIDFYGWKNIYPQCVEESRENIDVLASLAATPDGRVNTSATETDIDGGGILISGMSGYDPYNLTYNFGGWPGDGFKLQFANFVSTVETYTDAAYNNHYKFALMLGNTSAYYMQAWKGGNVSIVINGQNGTVELVKCYTQQLQWKTVATLIDDDAFLYENFTGKAFSFEFKRSGRKANEVQMDIDLGGTIYTGYIDYNVLMALTDEDGTSFANESGKNYYPTSSNLYVGFGGMDNDSKCSFCFMGYTDGVTPDYVADLQNSVENTVTTANDVYQKSGKTVIDIEGGGINYVGIGHSPFQLDAGMGRWPGNGIKLQFAHYAETSTKTDAVGYRQFVVFFNYGLANNGNYGPYWKGGNVGLNIDAVEGQLELVKSDQATLANTEKYVQKILIEDDMLLYDNLSGLPFSYEIVPTANNAAIIKITVGDTTRTCVVTYDEFVSYPEGFKTTNVYYPTSVVHEVSQCNVSFSALLHDGTGASVDFYGYTIADDGALSVGSTTAMSYESVSVPVSVTTATEQTMAIEVTADAAITAINAVEGVEIESVIDGTTAVVYVNTAVSGTDVKLFGVAFTTGADTIYTVEASVVADADGNIATIAGAKGGVVVTETTPEFSDVKQQATEGAYKLGTLGFETYTNSLSASAENLIAIEFGTVFFTQKLLGDQELVIGTKAANGGTAQAITVSKSLASNDTLPESFIAILKDKASNATDSVTPEYASTTFVARSFVKYMDADSGAIFVIYSTMHSQKQADMQ